MNVVVHTRSLSEMLEDNFPDGEDENDSDDDYFHSNDWDISFEHGFAIVESQSEFQMSLRDT